jgi:2-hydroxychromene-2-carboxylate isomerase
VEGRRPELPAFHYDFGSPYAYLAAERVEDVLGPVAWRPVFLVGVYLATGRRSWVYGDDPGPQWDEVARRLAARGLPPLALMEGWAERLVPAATPARSTLLAQRAACAAADAGAPGPSRWRSCGGCSRPRAT